jgi:hypothetical protein
MGGLVDQGAGRPDFRSFAARWFAALVAVFLRSVRDPVLAYDLATETLATAHLNWEFAPDSELAADWVLCLAAGVLAETVSRGRVPSTERRRANQSAPRTLTAAEQRELAALAERQVELPTTARDAADELARMAPPPHVLRALSRSSLVTAEQLPDHEWQTDGA